MSKTHFFKYYYFSDLVVFEVAFAPQDFVVHPHFFDLLELVEFALFEQDLLPHALSLCGATELISFDIELDILELFEFVILEFIDELFIAFIFFFLPNIISPFM